MSTARYCHFALALALTTLGCDDGTPPPIDGGGTVVASVEPLFGTPVVVVASQMRDGEQYSGISAYDVAMEGDEPQRDDPAGAEGFREQPGFPVVTEVDGEPYVFVAESRRLLASALGRLWGVRVRDGFAAVQMPLDRSGDRYVRPLVVDDVLYVNDCDASAIDTGVVQAYRIQP